MSIEIEWDIEQYGVPVVGTLVSRNDKMFLVTKMGDGHVTLAPALPVVLDFPGDCCLVEAWVTEYPREGEVIQVRADIYTEQCSVAGNVWDAELGKPILDMRIINQDKLKVAVGGDPIMINTQAKGGSA